MEALGGVASIIAVVDLSAKVLSLCSQYFKEVKNAKSDIEEIQKVVVNVQTQHEKTRTLLEGRMGFLLETSQQLIKGHHGCKRELEDLKSTLEQNVNTKNGSPRIMRKFGWRALKWPFDATTVQGTTQKLKEFQEDMTKGLIIDQTGLELSNIEHTFFQSISSIPYEKHHNSNSEKRTSDTCEWLLLHENFVEWQNSDSQVILWLQGQVGVGKTCLVSKAVDHMKRMSEPSPDEGFAFFYCDHQEELRQKPVSIFLCLLRQLLLTSTGHHKVEKELYDRWQSQKSQEIGLNLVECQEYLCRLIDESAKTTIILDAMDECEPKSRRSMIEGFKFISKKCHKPLRILVASRPERDIRDRLSAVSNIEVREEYNEADIQVFVKEEIVNHGNWRSMPPEIQLKIEETIMGRSHGMFQWAALQIQQLLEQESISNIKSRLGRLPSTLKDTYDELFATIRIRDGTDRLLVENALKWVMCAVEPLSKGELLSAIRLKIENDEFVLLEKIAELQLLKLCNHLRIFDTERDVWKFAHFSVAEYLADIGLDIRKSHSDVAKACLKLLNQTTIDYDQDESTSEVESSTTATDDIFRVNHPIQAYSRRHWIVHTQTQDAIMEEEQNSEGIENAIDCSLVRQLQKFMGSFDNSSQQYRCWLKHLISDYDVPRTSPFWCLCDNIWSWGYVWDASYNIFPESASILLASRFPLYRLLRDWWEMEYDLFQTNQNGSNLLALAAAAGSVPICEQLLSRGINTEGQRTNCAEALVASIDHGHIDVLNLLIKKGNVDPNMKIRSPGNILVRAVFKGNLEATRILVQYGRADVNAALRDEDYDRCSAAEGKGLPKFDNTLGKRRFGSALVAAAYKPRLAIVKFLVQECNADVDMLLHCGNHGSALAAAASKGYLKVVKFLVQDGHADVNMPLQHGDFGTALAYAASGRNLETVRFLVEECGAKVNLPEGIQLKHGLQCDAIKAARRHSFWPEAQACLDFLEAWESRHAGGVATNNQVVDLSD